MKTVGRHFSEFSKKYSIKIYFVNPAGSRGQVLPSVDLLHESPFGRFIT